MSQTVVWTLPNILTSARIAVAPVIAFLPFVDGYTPKLMAFVVFLAAAISDIYDGRLARERDQMTDLGALLDPLADKMLLFATLIPIYWLTRYPLERYELPWWGQFPLWVVLLLVGRELAMTLVRQVAQRRGVVIAAVGAGKLKTIMQDIFVGAAILWFAWKDMRAAFAWQDGWFAIFWDRLHGTVAALTLGAAVLLTAYSLFVYLYRYGDVVLGKTHRDGPPSDGP